MLSGIPMKMSVSLLLVLVPCISCAATDCVVTEYPDHYEAKCIGNPLPKADPAIVPPSAPKPANRAVLVQPPDMQPTANHASHLSVHSRKAAMDTAISARLKLIRELRQLESP